MITLLHPVPGATITGAFGAKDPPYPTNGHIGIDYSCWLRPVRAAHDGIAILCKGSSYGNYIRLIGYDVDAGMFETRYAHLNCFRVLPGQAIQAGEIIAISGATGKVTGAHLHFELRLKSQPTDPEPYLECEATPPQE